MDLMGMAAPRKNSSTPPTNLHLSRVMARQVATRDDLPVVTGRPSAKAELRRRQSNWAIVREIVARSMAKGITPIELLLDVMRDCYARYKEAVERGDHELAEGLLQKAVDCAATAAPYCHPKLNAIDVSAEGKAVGFVLAPAEAEAIEVWHARYGKPNGSGRPTIDAEPVE
jgi:hypothetical protein